MSERDVMVTGIKASTVAMFEGVFGAILGVVVSALYLLQGTVAYTNSTNSLIQGLLFGLTIGAMSVIVLPIIYFAIGWVIGYINGFVFNLVLRSSGGISIGVTPNEETSEMAGYAATQAQPTFGEKIERRPPK